MAHRFSSYFKRKGKKRDGTKSSSSPTFEAKASLAKSAEIKAAINGKTAVNQSDVIAESAGYRKEEIVESYLWLRAYQKLDDKTKTWIGDASKSDSGEERTQDLITLVRNREEEYKDGSPKIRVGDHEILWRDYANRVVMWVRTIGDISINFAPAGSSVAWSAVKVLLNDLAAIFGCAEKVLRLMRHGRVYEDVYLSGGSCNAATENLQDALVDLYKGLMELLAHAFIRLNEGQGKQFLRALVSGGEGAKLVSALTEEELKVSMAAQGCGAVASQEHQTLLKNLDEPIKNVEDTVKKLLQKVEHGILEQALEYISAVPIGEHQQEKHLLNGKDQAILRRYGFKGMTTLVLDALDECEMDTREALARILRNLVSKGEGTVKVFIASRKEADIEEHLGLRKLVEISTADNKEDIEKYVEEEISKVGIIWRSVSAEIKEQVKKTIGKKSDGMFRWAYLQWEELKKLRNSQSIHERLGKLPKSLTEAYEEIYLKNEERVVLQRAVKWLLCARRPLTSEELLMAIRLESNLESLTVSDPIDEPTLESICSHLIVLDSQLKVWKFPHASVAEYFENQHQSWIDKAAEEVAILLVSCLIDCYSNWALPELDNNIGGFFKTAPDLENYLDPRYPLQKYARKYWLQHVKNTPNQSQEETGLSEILKRFLGTHGPQQPSSRQYQAWCRYMDIRKDFDYDRYYFRDIKPAEKSIFGICVFGLQNLLQGWWDKDIDVSEVNRDKLDLLAIAARNGHDELCSELISRGSDIHKELDSRYGSAFMEAVAWSQVKTGTLLLDKGVNPNLVRKGRSPLCLAVLEAEDLVEPLLTAGADPNIACPKCVFVCGLEAAAHFNKLNSVRLLIKYGANVNLMRGRDTLGISLGTAASGSSLRCTKSFVENGDYGSVLAAAIFGYGGVQMVRYLIEEAGADPVILSLSPPRSPWVRNYRRTERQEAAKYLIEGGHIQESVLLNIGFPKEDLPGMKK
ncbi:hypothetical protein J3F84DRAFT_398058 [Trichoderma pleuroticola]